MKKQTHVLLLLFLLLVFLVNFLIYTTASIALAASPWNFGVDLSYEKTDETRAAQPQKTTTHNWDQEYKIRHHADLSSETREETELKVKFNRETRKDTDEPGTTLYEPYGKFQLRSRLYDLGLGYKESEEKTSTTRNTNNGFVDFKLQPEYLPELNIKYDRKGEPKDDGSKSITHNFSANSVYNVTDFLKIRLDYKGEITDYRENDPNSTQGDTDERNFIGQVTFKHFLFNNKLRFDLDYKLEKEDEKQHDPQSYASGWGKTTDELIQTTTTKFSYTIIPGTVLTAHYENKDTQDKIGADEQTDTFRTDISQQMWSFMKLLGKYKYEKNQEKTQEETIDTYEAEIRADPQTWLDLRGKLKLETNNTDDMINDAQDKKENTQTIEGNWRADFPQLFNARNTFNVKLVKDKVNDVASGQENRYEWKLQLTPVNNFMLTPEYNFSKEKDAENNDTVTREFKTVIAYGFQLVQRLNINLSHSLSRKRVEHVQTATEGKENDDDTKLDIKFTPTQNLIFSSQIIRETNKTIEQGDVTKDVNTSWGLNYDWRFDPFTWSSSFKYDNRNYSGDTETVESKLSYKIKNYDLTTNYRYSKTYDEDNDKEQRIGLQIRAYY